MRWRGALALLLLSSTAWGQTPDRLTMTWPCVSGVDAYSVLAQKDGEAGWTLVGSVPAEGCVEGKASLAFDHVNGTGRACYRLMTMNLIGSASTTTMLCHDPRLEPPPTPATVEGGRAGSPP